MFSHIVTAAKGLFARPESEETSATTPSEGTTTNNPKMVSATRQRDIATEDTSAKSDMSSTPATNGKRKARTANSGKVDGQHNKRQKKSSLEAPEKLQDGGHEVDRKSSPKKEQQPAPAVKKNHVRFGSEEPDLPVDLQEEVPEEKQDNQEDGEESSDDDAPEAIDNSAQMSKIKAEAQKLHQAKQREAQLKKEKRKQLDEQRKLQAKLANRKLEAVSKPSIGTSGDDLVSESTETLQGSITNDSRRLAVPALLPDEILNAAPAARPPTPPAEDDTTARKPNKLKFLDKVEKPPKDVKMGDVTIRVLDEAASQKKNKTTLPPKASKVGRNSRDNWLKGQRSTAHVNGLRRTAGGAASKGFVRK
ncbi:hypothetical protein PHISCL_06277 [Aspergillus sclerotialis]|uniref:Immediate-early protein n=1 Tax=Aspergillus sclerotialis TaxID=2070753 RepID=A0A3A2ZGH6_9EURO|nr:hypothetical protein PHISCL_06277 [Aspergillus sclerotialis]